MQEALNNPHFKKIWEKVIRNNNPTAKSFAEGLQDEIQYPHCVYILFGNQHITENNQITAPISSSVKILGRPITLFDILFLLNNMKEQKYCFTSNGYVICYTREDNILKELCDFNTNLLEEQTPETWEKIAELI